MPKQSLFDIIIVLVIPVALVVGYLYVGTDQLTSLFSFSQIGTIATPGTEEVGTTTRAALAELKSIRLDESIFSDSAYQSLVDFSGTIGTTSVGREYPFSMPDEIRAKLQKAAPATTTSISGLTSPNPKVTGTKKVVR